MAQGEVTITLSGREETLKSTLRAARDVNAACGGFIEAYRKLMAFDFEAYVAIVASGLGKKRQEVEDDVFKTGLASLSEPLAEFVGYLSNGGRDPAEKDQEEAKPGEA